MTDEKEVASLSYLILVAILFVAGLLFLPRGVDSGVRNAPLLIGILAVLFVLLVVSLWKRIRLKRRVARELRAAGYRICHRWRSVFRNRLFAERDGEVSQILLLTRGRRGLRYHFADVNTVEFYKNVQATYVNRRGSGHVYVGATETHRAGKRKLRWAPCDPEKETKRFLVFDSLPERMTDTRKSHDLGAGDTIGDSAVCVYDAATFAGVVGGASPTASENRQPSAE